MHLDARWCPALRHEIALHRAVPLEALLLVAMGLQHDVANYYAFHHAARHYPCHRRYDEPPCGECRRLERMRQWLVARLTEVSESIAIPWTGRTYSAVRQRVGAGEPLSRQPCHLLLARFRTDDEREALVVLLWIARRYLALTHPPGALTARWTARFRSRDVEQSRVEAIRAALDPSQRGGDADVVP